jgi:hypothetical protein
VSGLRDSLSRYRPRKHEQKYAQYTVLHMLAEQEHRVSQE